MTVLTPRALFGYGLFGLPLAMVSLPIYVYVPQFYAEHFGLSLTLIGAVLLAARVLDAFIDPLIGVWIDRDKSGNRYARFILISLPLLAIGFIALFHPLTNAPSVAWFVCALTTVYSGFSIATIAHQSWGAALTQAPDGRSHLTATREACGLIGVILAALITGWLGASWLSGIFVIALFASALVLITRAPRPAHRIAQPAASIALLMPFRTMRFRWLLAVFIVNGIAAAIPATLFLFFAKDQLRLPQYAPLFLVLYFVAAACSMPLWAMLAKRHGEARIWLIAMLLAAFAFVWAFALPAGAGWLFGLICVLSGLTLGADLALPPALLAAIIGKAGHSGQREGAYFGLWSWATKMNLALAAGVSLPLLELLGYAPNLYTEEGLHALSFAYALLPCALKLIAATILARAPLHNV